MMEKKKEETPTDEIPGGRGAHVAASYVMCTLLWNNARKKRP
jgi:hypothetical protein